MSLNYLECQAPTGLDLGSEEHLAAVDALTDAIGAEYTDEQALAELERDRLNADDTSLAMQLAIKLARSRNFVQHYDGPVKLSVVFAVFKEHNRLRPRSMGKMPC